MPRTADDNKEIRDKRKRELLDAALKVFAGRGLGAAKISDIAREAGLSHGLIYHYFSSKEEVFTELVREALEYSNNAFRKACSLPLSPLGKIAALTDNLIKDAYSGRGVNYFLIIIEASTSDDVPLEAQENVEEKGRFARRYLLPLIRQGQEVGTIVRVDPEKLANAYMSLIRGMALIYTEAVRENTFPDTKIIMNLFRE